MVGEPLLKKDLIYETVEYIDNLKPKIDTKFSYSLTTNGTLIDDEFIKIAQKNDFLIGYSLDGNPETQNKNRTTHLNTETFNIVYENAKKLIKSINRLVAMPVVTKNNYMDMTENAIFLFNLGFKHINFAFDYLASWNDEDLVLLKKEYQKLAELYYNKTKNGDIFYLLPFDDKISNYIKERKCEENCVLGAKHVEIGANKKIYPCTQYVGKKEYEIGDTTYGIDDDKLKKLKSKLIFNELDVCKECGISTRCKHTCGCLNLITSNNPLVTSPLVCEIERMFIEISDNVAERLYKEKIKTFYKKEYYQFF